MYTRLLIFFALSCEFYHHVSANTDTVIPIPSGPAPLVNFTGWSDAKPPEVTMNGHNNYQAAQQIFYIYGINQLKNLPFSQRFTTEQSVIEKVPSDYIVTPGIGAHKFHTRKLNWAKARRICNQEGGHLAVINSDSEELILLRMQDEHKLMNGWLGVHDMFEEGDWVTVHDEPLEKSGYSRWSSKIPNLPDNAGGRQNCGMLMKDGGMDDVDCSLLNSFFCEISL